MITIERYVGNFPPLKIKQSIVEGSDRVFHSVDFPEIVAVVVYNMDTKSYAMVEQYRVGAGESVLEIPAGKVDAGDYSIPSAAKREVLEETGYRVKDLRYLTSYYVSPGYTSEYIHLFLAFVSNEDRIAKGGEEEGEDVTIVHIDHDVLWGMIDDRTIEDGKTLVAMSLVGLRYGAKDDN